MAEIVYELEGLEKLDKELKYLQTHAVKVGVLGKKESKETKYPIVKIQEYSVYVEYGTSRGIPARPFFRLSVGTANAQNEIKEFMKKQVEQIIQGGITGQQAYENLGIFVVKKIRSTIESGGFVALNPKTIKIRQKNNNHSTTPLMDTHSLYNSISYEIVGV
jgi:hypothetical protein|nr:MAG TPA: virion morphogenesis protein [Caudoviricetes sp.]